MSDMIIRDAAYAAVQALIKDATIIGQRTMISHALTAIRALPAVEVGVTQGEIERAIWDAMGWVLRHAKQLPGDVIPTYTDGGNSDAETECRRAAARIRSALTATPAQDVAGLVEAALERPDVIAAMVDAAEIAHSQGVSFNVVIGRARRAALARMKEDTK